MCKMAEKCLAALVVVVFLVISFDVVAGGSGKCKDRRFAPVFAKKQEHLESYTNSENDKIRRRCRAIGNPEPTVTWYKDGKPLQESDRITMKKSSLSITGLIYSDEGTYKCVVSNECGSIEWTFTQLVVVNEIGGKVPPLLLQEVRNVTVYEGEDAKFQCLFYTNDPPTIWWLFYGWSNGTSDPQTLEIDYDHPQTYVVHNAQLNDSGMYECVLRNKYGISGRQQWLMVEPAPETPSPLTYALPHPGQNGLNNTFISLIVTGVLILVPLIAGIITLLVYQRKRRLADFNKPRETVLNPIYPFIPPAEMNIPYDPRWEFPRSNLDLGEVVGVGFFGQVMKGYAIGLFGRMEPVIVAVKMLKSDATQRELNTLIQEMNTMKSIGCHINIINFLGCCTQDGPLFMLVEFAEHGNLRDFLRRQKPQDLRDPAICSTSDGYERPQEQNMERTITPLTTKDLVSFAYQIARGMEYLSSKKIIHRDLAARNILVAENYIMKIADFGLTKELRESEYYTKQTETPLPIKWMALECLRDKKFTPKSDVWSYGILLWEIFTFGGNPYPSVNVLSLDRFYEWLEKGNRMDKPRHSPEEMYALMLKCWKPLPVDRPTFCALVLQLDQMLCNSTSKVYLNLDVDLNYIMPLHGCDEEDDNDIDDLDDSVFRAGHGESNLLIGTKNSRRSDSQYSSLASSQEQSISNSSVKGDCNTLLSSCNSSLHSLSHSSYSSLSDGSIGQIKDRLITGYDMSGVSVPLSIPLLKNQFTAWSRSADDVAKIQSPLLSSCYYHSDGHIDDVPESEDDDDDDDELETKQSVVSQDHKTCRNLCQNKAWPSAKHWKHSVDSMIIVSDEDDDDDEDESNEKSQIQPCLIIYNSDKVECVESFV